MKRTPAPWHPTQDSEIGFDDKTIRITERPHYGGRVIASVWECKEQAANAALIAASPKMAEELENALMLLWMVQEGQTIPPAELQNRIDAISEILAPLKG